MFVYVHKNYRCVAFRLSINMPENAKNSVLETLDSFRDILETFLGERGPNPPRPSVLVLSSPPQSYYPGDATA